MTMLGPAASPLYLSSSDCHGSETPPMTTRRAWIIAASLAVTMIAGAPYAWAQFNSAIEGTVVDPQGGVIPGASVSITNEETGVTHTLTTTDAGYYRQPSLPGGLYTVRVSLSGF